MFCKSCKSKNVEIIYFGREVCMVCWEKHCDFPFLKKKFRIKGFKCEGVVVEKEIIDVKFGSSGVCWSDIFNK